MSLALAWIGIGVKAVPATTTIKAQHTWAVLRAALVASCLRGAFPGEALICDRPELVEPTPTSGGLAGSLLATTMSSNVATMRSII
jgi:hypothetical protein